MFQEKNTTKDYQGSVMANSPKEALKIFFEPEEILVKKEEIIYIIEKEKPSNSIKYENGKFRKIE